MHGFAGGLVIGFGELRLALPLRYALLRYSGRTRRGLEVGVRGIEVRLGFGFGWFFGEVAYLLPIARDVRQLFSAGPLFDFSLSGQGVVFGLEGFDVDALDGAAGGGEGLGVCAGLVLVESAVGVVGGADVEGTVAAL